MPKCIDQDFVCQNPDYSDFDKIAEIELRNPISASDFINKSKFCFSIVTDKSLQIGDLTKSLPLKTIQGKIGVYHLWSEYDDCDDHNTHTMKCEYVGKGLASLRVDSHIKKSKWKEGEMLYVTFHECQNRIAKYLEQLFLDTYHFDLNTNENSGRKILYAVWDNERFDLGTHSNEISAQSKMQGPEDW